MVKQLLARYGITTDGEIKQFGNGLINSTWIAFSHTGEKYILQRVNTTIFKNPDAIVRNIRLISNYLKKEFPNYLLPTPMQTPGEEELIWNEGNCFRLVPFVTGSHTVNVVETPAQAYAAARAFGKFTRLLSGFNSDLLEETLPHFHDLSHRFDEFKLVLDAALPALKAKASEAISFVLENTWIIDRYEDIIKDSAFEKRIIHHDTKISNVLFDKDDRVLCVIDLDTVMPGYFISDLGDMIRTYVCPVSEEERDFEQIVIRPEYLRAVLQGYLSEMGSELNPVEKRYLVYSGLFMTYMQAMRFLTDYLDNDRYYGAKYEGHNLTRALNQARLFTELEAAGDFGSLD